MEKVPPELFYNALVEFNAGKFFECHESLEIIWNAEPGEIRRLYQGILQIGVGFYHATVRRNYRGATALLAGGIEKCQPFAPTYFGVDLEKLLTAARLALQHIEQLGLERMAEFDRNYIPQISYQH